MVTGYALWRRKPVYPILLTTLFANIIKSFLWIAALIFFQHYLVALLLAETLIWILESALLYVIPANQLGLPQVFFLSLGMNLFIVSLGWFLPS